MRSDSRQTALPEWDEPRRLLVTDHGPPPPPRRRSSDNRRSRVPLAVVAGLVLLGGGAGLGYKLGSDRAEPSAAVASAAFTSAASVAPSTTAASTAAASTAAPSTALSTTSTTAAAAPTSVAVVVPPGEVIRPHATLAAGTLTLTGSVPSQAIADRLTAAARSLGVGVAGGYTLDPRSAYTTGGIVEMTDLIRFDRGGTEPTADSKGLLDTLAAMMVKAPDSVLVIAAYTDTEGDPLRNVGLAGVRIDTMAAYLGSKGVAASRVVPAPRGGAEPVADNTTEEGRAANRRARAWLYLALGS